MLWIGVRSKEQFFEAAAFFNGRMRLFTIKSKGLYFLSTPKRLPGF